MTNRVIAIVDDTDTATSAFERSDGTVRTYNKTRKNGARTWRSIEDQYTPRTMRHEWVDTPDGIMGKMFIYGPLDEFSMFRWMHWLRNN